MNDDTQKLKLRIEELEQENERLINILKTNDLFEEKNEDYPLHTIWFESGKYAGV